MPKAKSISEKKSRKPTSKRNEPAFKAQLIRTKFLNDLAGELNRVIAHYYTDFKPADLYHRLQKQFRKEPLDNRFLLLLQLVGMEINPVYPLAKLGHAGLRVEAVKKNISITLDTLSHPDPGKHRANGYYHELLLFCWDKTKKPARVSRQLSDWIRPGGPRPQFEFVFPLPANATHWLLCLRQSLGVNEVDIGAKVTMGMAVVEAGSFDKKDMALVEKRKGKKVGGERRMEMVEEVRVKAKKV